MVTFFSSIVTAYQACQPRISPSPAGGAQAAGALDLQEPNVAEHRRHLVVMVHGLFGSAANWRVIARFLEAHLDPRTTLLYVSTANQKALTFQGIDICGERLADEIRGVIEEHPGLERISLFGHSMGGLIARFAAGRLYEPESGTMCGLRPCHYVSLATPHLGCDGELNPAQVPLLSWAGAVPAIGGGVQHVLKEAAVPFAYLAFGRAGMQFFLMDRDGAGSQEPLLLRLTRDHPVEGYFMSALEAFETRTCYANKSGDHLVGWANSSLRTISELPKLKGRGRGVMREDPLEAAWHPQERPGLEGRKAPKAAPQGSLMRPEVAHNAESGLGRPHLPHGRHNTEVGTGRAESQAACSTVSSNSNALESREIEDSTAGVVHGTAVLAMEPGYKLEARDLASAQQGWQAPPKDLASVSSCYGAAQQTDLGQQQQQQQQQQQLCNWDLALEGGGHEPANGGSRLVQRAGRAASPGDGGRSAASAEFGPGADVGPDGTSTKRHGGSESTRQHPGEQQGRQDEQEAEEARAVSEGSLGEHPQGLLAGLATAVGAAAVNDDPGGAVAEGARVAVGAGTGSGSGSSGKLGHGSAGKEESLRPGRPRAPWSSPPGSNAADKALAAERGQYVGLMLARLQALPWRRVDVCFGRALLPFLAHQHMQARREERVQRWWVNFDGVATAKHFALQVAAMEELRESDSDDLLKHVDVEHREAVARILEQAERAADSWATVYTDFQPPPVIADAMMGLQQMAGVIVLGREELLESLREQPSQLEGVAAVQCKGNFMFDPATHRDFLGACLGTGIDRSKVGDILLTGEQGAQILVAPNLVEHLVASLTQVRTVPVETREVSLESLQVRAPRVEEISSVEASLRLDAVASAGFRMSRSKMMDLIKAGTWDVRVNWKSGAKPSSEVKAGDLVSCSGKGRVEVVEASLTKKGKYAVRMVRYV
ncbi:hypothetical protein N2152v2_008365 [Parachlorella kessleri]